MPHVDEPQREGAPEEAELQQHLARAAEHLRADRLTDAAAEISSALLLSPSDVRARNLLGLLHFRAGRFEEARIVYTQLLEESQSEPSLLLNLGLVELRMGHNDLAAEHLRWVVDAEPDNTRALGYYGLALMRAGSLELAQTVLRRAGQSELLQQVERMLAAQGGPAPPAPGPALPPEVDLARPGNGAPASAENAASSAPPIAPPPSQRSAAGRLPQSEAELDREGRAALAEARRAAAAGAKALEIEQPFVPAEAVGEVREVRREGSWQMRPASQGLPLPHPSSRSPLRPIPVPPLRSMPAITSITQQRGAQPLMGFLRDAEVCASVEGQPFTITADGLLVIRISGQLPTRSIGVVVSTGSLGFEPLLRRARGRILKEQFGNGPFGMSRASGDGMMIISPRGGRFVALSIQEESLYVRESATFAFDENLHFENGRLPGAAPAPAFGHPGLPEELSRVVQFRGRGQLVLRTDRPIFTVRLGSGQTSFIEVEHLVGWTGRIIPSLLTQEGGIPTPYVECSGEGFLLVEPPPEEPVAAPAQEPSPPADPPSASESL